MTILLVVIILKLIASLMCVLGLRSGITIQDVSSYLDNDSENKKEFLALTLRMAFAAALIGIWLGYK